MKAIRIYFLGIIIMSALLLTGCSAPKKITYFQDTDTNAVIQAPTPSQIKIEPGDKLSIIVKTKDAAVSALFNLPVYSSRIGQGAPSNGTTTEQRNYTGSGNDGVASYTVAPDGKIDFPVLGYLEVAGMTRSELAAFIKGELLGRNLVKDPTVIVEFLSSGFSVMGEVARPGRYDLNRDQINVLEAIALAGDLTINGQRENVKVVRQFPGGKIETYDLDLTNAKQMASSPGFYLHQNDVIYVEPNSQRKRSSTVNGNNALSVGFWVSVASLLTSVVTTVAVFINK